MPKNKQSPGTALSALLEKHGLNYNRLAKAIGLSSAMVRLIARDENPVSANAAFRLAKFFKTKPEYWMSLQLEFELSRANQNKDLAKDLKEITTVDKATFERKPKTARSAASAKATKGKAAPKKKATKPALKKDDAKKTKSPKAKKVDPPKSGKAPVKAKPVKADKAAAVKKEQAPAAKKSKPAAKAPAPVRKVPPVARVKPAEKPEPKAEQNHPAVAETQPVTANPAPAVPPDPTINEPQL